VEGTLAWHDKLLITNLLGSGVLFLVSWMEEGGPPTICASFLIRRSAAVVAKSRLPGRRNFLGQNPNDKNTFSQGA
jgi:hypothetical protein